MAFNASQPRDARGRFVSAGVTRDHVVRVLKPTTGSKLVDSGVTEEHRISVKSSRVRKYAGHETVGSYVAAHPKGRATALRTLAVDHKAGRIGFEAPIAAKTAARADAGFDAEKVAGHVSALKAASGSDRFAGVLKDVESSSAAHVKEVAKRFVGAAKASKSANISAMNDVHLQIVRFQNKLRAVE